MTNIDLKERTEQSPIKKTVNKKTLSQYLFIAPKIFVTWMGYGPCLETHIYLIMAGGHVEK